MTSVHALSSNSRPQVRPSSSTLEECTFAGNIGFDPCQLASSRPTLLHYRESEIKHARLAMLASMLWLIVEQDSPWWYDDSDSFIAFLPLLQRVAPAWWGACVGLVALSEINTYDERDEMTTMRMMSRVMCPVNWDGILCISSPTTRKSNKGI